MVKEKVLKILEQKRGEFISGQELADRLGVSRAAVWKAVQALRNDGYHIQAGTNKGYLLDMDNDILSAEGLRVFLDSQWTNSLVVNCESVDSTNYYARKLALSCPEPLVIVLANEQTGGRGRMGRSFFSPPDTGLYLSILLRPDSSLEGSAMITVAAAVAVCQAIEKQTAAFPLIKWVNDIYLNEKKIGGILTEAVSDFESGRLETLIIGIGVNISTKTEDFPKELQTRAGSLFPADLTRNQLAAEIINHLLFWQSNLNHPQLIREYRQRSFLLDKEVFYQIDGRLKQGLVMDINNQGHLVIKTPAGDTEVLHSGEVSLSRQDYLF